jgi:hypothetical protein
LAVAALSLAIGIGVARSAAAADFCIDFPFETIVAHQFRIPRPGKCTTVAGHVSGLAGETILVSGSACTTTDSRVAFSLTQHQLSGTSSDVLRTDYFIEIQPPALTGQASLKSEGFSPLKFPVSVIACRESDLQID